MNLQSDITTLKGVGEKSAALFRKLHIESLKDLLFYFPRDYESFEEPVCISDLRAGEVCAIRGLVTGTPLVKQVRSLKILTVSVRDATGTMQLTFFNMPFLKNTLKSGQIYLFRGMVQEKYHKGQSASGEKPVLGSPALVMEQPKIYQEEEYKS
ncbi:MAG: ATP-dependent DNA helicase RecG, partial [Lachnospiraceae bacterium]|nr:ATP-dependent DNA helicase RecG [Lachnospiraceae bacterium]